MPDIMTVITDYDFVVLDTETTGLDNGAEIVQIAIIDRDGETLIDTLVRPKNPIPPSATAIHHIHNDMVYLSPTFPEILPKLIEILAGKQVIAYNAKFDRNMLHSSADVWGIPRTDWKSFSEWHCAMQKFAEIYGEIGYYGLKRQKLSTACTYYGIPHGNGHDALSDCQSTLALCKAMVKNEFE